ncbi:hypothetical protein HYS49_02345, partial [Candidatus Woesearchaeota archaeon]|nr:hypothetical protein [Candidatus Woesearchaeota archaeon]
MAKKLKTAATLACLGAILSSTPCAETPAVAGPPPPAVVQEDGESIVGEGGPPVPQEAFVNGNEPCREARTLYNLLMEKASSSRPGEWLSFWIREPYIVTAGWYETEGRGLLLELHDEDLSVVGFFDGHDLNGYVNVITVGDGPTHVPTDLEDTIFYRWALDNVWQIMNGEA